MRFGGGGGVLRGGGGRWGSYSSTNAIIGVICIITVFTINKFT